MSFARYPKYKDSGVEWLGEVPAHWDARPIKALALLKGGAGFPDAEQGLENEELNFYKVGSLGQANAKGILQASPDSISRDTAKRLGAFVFPAGALTFAKVGAALLLARIRQLSEPSCIDNNMMGMLVTKANDARFVMFAMSLVRFDLIANPGAVPSLNASQIGGFQLAVPPLPEQLAIANFLDRETAKIDTLVAEKEKLIALLQEKRHAVISHAVKKGLDPNVPMKNSAVDWLGEVPAHWFVIPLLRTALGAQSLFIDGDWIESKDLADGGVRYITTGNIGEGVYREQGQGFISAAKFLELQCKEVQSGDILISRLNIPIGRSCLAPDLGSRVVTSVDNVIFRPDPEFHRSFLVYLLSSKAHFANMENLARGTTMQRISRSALGRVRFAFPSFEEQTAIAVFLDRETGKLDTLITEVQSAVALLQERRTALISAAVTGQIDVRGFAPT